MGFFGKKRIGTLQKIKNGRQFMWEIPNISTYPPGSTLDSPLETHFAGARFHFHLFFSTSGYACFYIHFKISPIPKYSYFFQNSKKEMMRQQTAHTIPVDAERLGHSNVCSRSDLMEFLGDGADTLFVMFTFDDDTINTLSSSIPPPQIVLAGAPAGGTQHLPISGPTTAQNAYLNGEEVNSLNRTPEAIQFLWKIPSFKEKFVWPYTSCSFTIGSTSLVGRIDVRRHSSTSCIAINDYNDIESIIIFVFSRGGEISSHAIELVKGAASPACTEAYASVAPKPSGVAQGLLVSRTVLDDFFSTQLSNTTQQSSDLYVRFTFLREENPLSQLHSRGFLSSSTHHREAVIPSSNNGEKVQEQNETNKKYIQMTE